MSSSSSVRARVGEDAFKVVSGGASCPESDFHSPNSPSDIAPAPRPRTPAGCPPLLWLRLWDACLRGGAIGLQDEPDETVREEGHVSEADRNGEDPKSADDPVNDGSAGGDRPGFPVDESSPWLTSSPSSGGELLIGLHDAGVTVVRDGAEFSSVWAGERHGLEPVPGYVDPNQLGDSEPVTR